MTIISVGSAPTYRGSQFRVANTQLYNEVDDVQTKRGEFFLLQKLDGIRHFPGIRHNRFEWLSSLKRPLAGSRSAIG